MPRLGCAAEPGSLMVISADRCEPPAPSAAFRKRAVRATLPTAILHFLLFDLHRVETRIVDPFSRLLKVAFFSPRGSPPTGIFESNRCLALCRGEEVVRDPVARRQRAGASS